MSWEPEDYSDIDGQSQAAHTQMTIDTGNPDAGIIWSDDPERAYFRSLVGQEDYSLVGDNNTVNDGADLQRRNVGASSSFSPRNIATSGLSYYDTDAEDDTIANIEPDQQATGWFTARRSAANRTDKQGTNAKAPPPKIATTSPAVQDLALNITSPISALSPVDKAGNGQGNSLPFAVPNKDLVPESTRNGAPTGKSKIVPGYIIVTSEKSAKTDTHAGNGKAQKPTTTVKVLKEVTPDEDDNSTGSAFRQRLLYIKVVVFLFMLALIAGIVALSIVFKQRRDDTVKPPTLPPFFTSFTDAPSAPATPSPTMAKTHLPTGLDSTPSPIMPAQTPTSHPTTLFSSSNPTTSTLGETTPPTMAPTNSIALFEEFLIVQSPNSVPALQSPTSPQYQALEWISHDPYILDIINAGRRHLQLGDDSPQEMMDWRVLQRWVLATFYYSTNGNTNWGHANGWLEPINECDWEFTTCSEDGRVQQFIAEDNGLAGTLPMEIGLLGEPLEWFSLTSNSIEGDLPTSLGLLVGVQRMTLNSNDFVGVIPTELGNMAALEYLSLRANELTGSIPTEFGNAQELRTLDLASTDVTGAIPSELGRCTRLELITMGSTFVSGPIPEELGELPLLNEFSAARTSLTGSIPTGFCTRGVLDFIRLDCQEVECPCCSYCCIDNDICFGPTPSPTIKPTRSPTISPTMLPTAMPIPTMPPTFTATASPTKAPILLTQAPTSSPISAPPTSRSPVVAPQNPTLEPTCQGFITAEFSCYQSGDDIQIFFENCDPQGDDWIGIYAAGQDVSNLGDPLAWVYTSGNKVNDQIPVMSGSITLFTARGQGLFQAILARDEQTPPVQAYAASATWEINISC